MPMLTADVPSELIEQLDRAAKAQSEQFDVVVSRSSLVRRALREFLARLAADRPSQGTIVPELTRDAA